MNTPTIETVTILTTANAAQFCRVPRKTFLALAAKAGMEPHNIQDGEAFWTIEQARKVYRIDHKQKRHE